MVDSTAPNVYENLAMEYEVVNDSGLGSERGWRVRGLKSPIHYEQFQVVDESKK
jgi:hypothetical protein